MIRRTIVRRNVNAMGFEGMPRYPNLSVLGALRGLDYAGTTIFAVSGSILASMYGMDALGCVVVGCVTALGGGTVRDVIWGKAPAFWLDETEYLYMSIAAAAAAFWFCYYEEPGKQLLEFVVFWGDTLGIGAFSVIGTMYAIRMGFGIIITLVCCCITCTGGGVIRDTLVKRPVRIMHNLEEVYAEAAVSGGAAYLLARGAGLPLQVRVLVGAGTTIALRILATKYDVKNLAVPAVMGPLKEAE
jgi:uncharacterized membrane protein YeiH